MAIYTGPERERQTWPEPAARPHEPTRRPPSREWAGALRRRPAALGVLAAIALVAVFAFIALARGRTSGYTGSERATFISGCTRNAGATTAQCGCMFDRISAQLPHAAYLKANSTGRKDWSPQTSRTFAAAVSACTGIPGATS